MRTEHEATVRRCCTTKTAMGQQAARAVAGRARAEGIALHPYRCPFCGAWHVGHVPSVRGVEAIAAAIRDLPPAPAPPVGVR